MFSRLEVMDCIPLKCSAMQIFAGSCNLYSVGCCYFPLYSVDQHKCESVAATRFIIIKCLISDPALLKARKLA